MLAELQTGVPRACREVDRAGVRTARWLQRRPLHPHRLLAALEDGSLLGVARVHGYLWVATRPGTVIEIDAGFDDCELAEGEEGWRTWPDPFREWLGEEAAFLSSASNDPEEETPCKDSIHPRYRPVVFRDRAAGYAFLTRSTAATTSTISWGTAPSTP